MCTHVYFLAQRKMAGKNTEKAITGRFFVILQLKLWNDSLENEIYNYRHKVLVICLIYHCMGTKLCSRKNGTPLVVTMMAEVSRTYPEHLRIINLLLWSLQIIAIRDCEFYRLVDFFWQQMQLRDSIHEWK